jgi:hypothetical protein
MRAAPHKEGSEMRITNTTDRRTKLRFAVNRELRYKLTDSMTIVAAGQGETVDMSSGGISFRTNTALKVDSYIELSISWPALLDGNCPMRLVVYGKVVRYEDSIVACSVEKWEFRTGSRHFAAPVIPMRTDERLIRWMEYRKEVSLKASATA